MKLFLRTLGAGALAALAQAAPAQDSRPEPAFGFSPPGYHPLQAGVVYGERSPTEIRAASRSWKARFAPEHVTFVPFFGSHQPRSLPLVLRFESFRAGGIELASAASTLGRAGERVAIDRGRVEEAWQLGDGGIEQLFVVHERPAPGDLVVRIAFEGEYEAGLDEEGILFTSELGAVRYGRAFAFDAAGVRTDVCQSLEGEAIVLRVPANFVERARFPLTIDPWVSTFGVQTSLADTCSPEVAFEATSGRYVFVYESIFSQTDRDIYSVFATDSGIVTGTTQAIDSSILNWARPRVAACRRGTSFLVVAEVGQPGTRHVYARMLDSENGTFGPGPSIGLSTSFSAECTRPDVGGDPSDDGYGLFCVVWEMSYGPPSSSIAQLTVDPVSAELSSLELLDAGPQHFDTQPAIARSCGLPQDGPPHWTVVWQRRVSVQDHDIHGAQIARDGGIHTAPFAIASSWEDDIEPSVSPLLRGEGSHRPYAVAWSSLVGPSNHDVKLASMNGAQVLGTMTVSAGQPSASADDRTPRLDSDGHLFALSFTKVLSASNSDLWLNWVWAVGSTIERLGNHELVASTSKPEFRASIASNYAGGQHSRRMAIAWEVDQGTHSDILASIFEAPVQVPVESFCSASAACPCGSVGQPGGCSNSANANGAYLSHSGHPNVSADSLLLTASGMPATVPCLFLQGTSAVNGGSGLPFGDGLRCVGGGVVRLATKVASFGTAAYPQVGDLPISQRGAIPSIGGLRTYQLWYRDPVSHCTSATFNFTNGLKARWLP